MRYAAAAVLSLLVTTRADALPAPGSTYHILFATTDLYEITPNQSYPPTGRAFGNITGADWQVTFSALTAGLPGPSYQDWNGQDRYYHALLSQNGNNLRDRLVVDGPIYNTHGTRLATSKNDLLDGSLEAPVDFDEFATYILFDPDVWTGSTSVGTWALFSAGNWNNVGAQAQVGNAFVSDGAWLYSFGKSAAQSSRLYGISDPLTAPLWGDFDASGQVDGSDFLNWQRSLGQVNKPWDTSHYRGMGFYGSLPSGPPVNGVTPYADVESDAEYLKVWREYNGQSLTVIPSAQVPEPVCKVLGSVAALALAMRRRR